MLEHATSRPKCKTNIHNQANMRVITKINNKNKPMVSLAPLQRLPNLLRMLRNILHLLQDLRIELLVSIQIQVMPRVLDHDHFRRTAVCCALLRRCILEHAFPLFVKFGLCLVPTRYVHPVPIPVHKHDRDTIFTTGRSCGC